MMTEAAVSADLAAPKGPNVFARLIGVLFSPRATYAAVVARPRVLAAFAITVGIIAVTQGVFFATPVMQEVLLDQQVRMIESFGVNISDEMYAGIEQGVARAPYQTPISVVIIIPMVAALLAAMILGIWGMLLGGVGTFKQVYAILAHSGIIFAMSTLLTMPLSYAVRRISSATLDVFVPMVEETSFVARFLGAIDLFWIWWCISVAIGVGVLFKRKTGGVAMTFLGIYVCVALVLAFARSGS
jgi:hypothetical protein